MALRIWDLPHSLRDFHICLKLYEEAELDPTDLLAVYRKHPLLPGLRNFILSAHCKSEMTQISVDVIEGTVMRGIGLLVPSRH
jgi:hypothetical protein